MVIVVLKDETHYPKIKKYLNKRGVVSQVLRTNEKLLKIGVMSNVLKQINGKVNLDLCRLHLPKLDEAMIVGIDIVNKAR